MAEKLSRGHCQYHFNDSALYSSLTLILVMSAVNISLLLDYSTLHNFFFFFYNLWSAKPVPASCEIKNLLLVPAPFTSPEHSSLWQRWNCVAGSPSYAGMLARVNTALHSVRAKGGGCLNQERAGFTARSWSHTFSRLTTKQTASKMHTRTPLFGTYLEFYWTKNFGTF